MSFALLGRVSRALILVLGAIACGPPAVTVLAVTPNACAFTQRATCKVGAVQVTTDLPEGTELSRPECDAVCISVNCAGEAKKCSVRVEAQTQVILCEPLGC